MNIGLVIFPFHPNHGSILQTFAIYTKLKEDGHNVTIINRRIAPPKFGFVLKRTLANLKKTIQGVYHGPIYYNGYSPKLLMQNLQPFIDSYFGDSVHTFFNEESVRKFIVDNNFDAFVVGSDQVWRPHYVPDIYHYYLGFVPQEMKCKRIALCPSFGSERWEYTEEQTKRCRDLITQFDAVAVREISGVKLCKDFLNKDVVNLLDPTVLFPSQKYADTFVNYADKKELNNVGQVSVYYIFNSEEKRKISQKVGFLLGKEVKIIISQIKDYNENIQKRIAPSLTTWIKGFIDADFVVTDSFHSTMFALYFNKPFVTIANNQTGSSRFQSILSALNMENRIIINSEDINESLLTEKIDWTVVNQYFEEQRLRSICFLRDGLK